MNQWNSAEELRESVLIFQNECADSVGASGKGLAQALLKASVSYGGGIPSLEHRKGPVVEDRFLGLVDYELRSSARWRRYASILVIGANGIPNALGKFRMFVAETMRGSDELVEIEGDRLAVLMPETSKADVASAVNRYCRRYGDSLDVRFGAASYPEDSPSAATLFQMACSRLNAAWQGTRNTVVLFDE